MNAISSFNTLVSPSDAIRVEAILSSPSQHASSRKLDSQLFHSVLMTSSPANKARHLSSSAAHASSWLSVVPSVGLGLHLESSEFHTAVKWWLGMNSTARSSCPFCPDIALDPLGAKPAAFDVTVTSPLTPVILNEACIHEGAAALAAKTRKHAANDARCQALGWSCIPLAVETF